MVERIVLFKLKPAHATEAGRREVAAESQRVLPSLPGVRSVAVGIPADDDSLKSWDLSLVLRFDDLEAVAVYAEHPDHRAFVDNFMMPRVVVRKAWNFHVQPSSEG
jgi:antibiotic biosynthesis monooxygenase (ABM) superfamily enzyme